MVLVVHWPYLHGCLAPRAVLLPMDGQTMQQCEMEEAGRSVNVGRLRAERALTHPATSLTTQTRDKTATLDPDCMQHCRFTANPAIAIRLRALVQAVV